MNKLLTGLIFLFVMQLATANQHLDSLISISQNNRSSYSERQQALKSLINEYKKSNIDSALYFVDKALKSAQEKNDLIGISTAYLSKGIVYGNFSKNNEAVDSYSEALNYANKSDDDKQITKVLINLGVAYNDIGNAEEALKKLTTCYEIASQHNNNEDALKALNSIGNTYIKQADYSKAQVAFFHALEINKTLNNDLYETVITNNIGNIYYYLFNYDKAIEYYYKSLKVAEKLNDEYFIVSAYTNIGVIYKDLGEYDKAIENTYRSVQFYLKNDDKYNATLSYNTLGLIYMNQNKLDSALICFNQAINLKKEIADSSGFALVYNNIGDLFIRKNNFKLAEDNLTNALELATKYDDVYNKVNAYLSLGDIHNDHPAEALNYYLLASKEANLHNMNSLSILAYDKLYQYYKKNGDYKNALVNYEKYTLLNDSLSGEDSKLKIEDIETRYEVDKKDTEILLLQKDKELKEIKFNEEKKTARVRVFLILLVSGIIILTFIIFFIRFRQKQKNKINVLEKRGLKVETEMLRSQMNPHFIFNSLNSIQTFISEHDTIDAERYLSKFAALMRLILDNSRQPFVTFDKEITTLELYLELEKLRFSNRFTSHIHINDIDDEFTMIPPMLAQPYIENAILHGFTGKTDGIIEINYVQTEGKIICTIDDNGIGRKKSGEIKNNTTQKSSLGIKVTEERIALLSEEFQLSLTVEIIDKTDEFGNATGTRVVIEMPYKD